MATDYDAPRTPPESPPELDPEHSAPRWEVIDADEGDLSDTFTPPGADLSNEELVVEVVPVQDDEFTCMSCFLVHHRSQVAREQDGMKYCRDCEG